MITGDMLIGALVMWYPQTVAIFRKYNMGCTGCHAARQETIAQGAQVHGIDLEALLAELNQAVGAGQE